MKKLYLGLLASVLLLPVPVMGQGEADSIPVIVYDRADMVVEVTPDRYRGWRGDTITFSAVILDGPTGDTIPAIVTWSERTGNVDIDPETGFATFNNRGRYQVIVTVERILNLQITVLEDDGSLTPIGKGGTDFPILTMEVGEERQLCAYVLGEFGTVIRPTLGQGTTCPYEYRGVPTIPSTPSLPDYDLESRFNAIGLRAL